MPGNPGNNLNYGVHLWFPLEINQSGSGIRFDDDPGLKHSSVGQCLMAYSDSTRGFL